MMLTSAQDTISADWDCRPRLSARSAVTVCHGRIVSAPTVISLMSILQFKLTLIFSAYARRESGI